MYSLRSKQYYIYNVGWTYRYKTFVYIEIQNVQCILFNVWTLKGTCKYVSKISVGCVTIKRRNSKQTKKLALPCNVP